MDVQYSSNTYSGVNVGDTTIFTCHSGFAIAGESSNTSRATCGDDGNWEVIPTCVGTLVINITYLV